jgi:hypothetical protein
MTENEQVNKLIAASKEIIADGCYCDRWCETEEAKGIKSGCSCYDDAERIVKLTVETIWNGGDLPNG